MLFRYSTTTGNYRGHPRPMYNNFPHSSVADLASKEHRRDVFGLRTGKALYS